VRKYDHVHCKLGNFEGESLQIMSCMIAVNVQSYFDQVDKRKHITGKFYVLCLLGQIYVLHLCSTKRPIVVGHFYKNK